MALEKSHEVYDHVRKGNRATPLSYWRYAGVLRFETLEPPHTILGKVAVIKLDGYVSAESRATSKDSGAIADFTHEFLLGNWQETFTETRPATIEEKKAARPDLNDEYIEKIIVDIIVKETVVDHNDFDDFMKDFGTAKEAETAYRILKSTAIHTDFFGGSVDV